MPNKKIIILSSIFLIFLLLLITGSENLVLNLLLGTVLTIAVIAFMYNKLGLFLLIILRPVLDYFSGKDMINIGRFSLNLASIFGILVILFCLFVIIKNHKKLKSIALTTNWTFFIIISFFSIFISTNPATSIIEFTRLISIVLIYFTSFLLIKTNKDLSKLIKVIIASAIVPSFFAFYQFIFNKGLTIVEEGIFNRIFGTFSHPNLLAFYILIPLSLCFIIFLVSNKRKVQIITYGFLSVFFILTLIFTYTRGAWIGFIIIAFIIGIVKFRGFLVIIVFTLIISYIGIDGIQSRAQETIDVSPYGSIQWRLNLWDDSLRYIKEKPILGHGVGTANETIYRNRGPKFGSTHPHNDYLKISLEMGILGLIAYLLLIINLLLKLFHIYKKEKKPNLRALTLVVLVLSISIFATSFGDNMIRNTALQWSFWALIGGVLKINDDKLLMINNK